jgi:hypothetical protein
MLTKKWHNFARLLVETGELDPVYDLIDRGGLDHGAQWRHQFALHFFMYYDVGQAAALANAQTELDFWHMQNFGYQGFKRGTERRHFRGEKGLTAMRTFQHMGSPGSIWRAMSAPTYHQLVMRVESDFQGCQMGPYFTWKAMDILDRCLGYSVELSLEDAVRYLPEQPRKCAKELWPTLSLADALRMVSSWICDLPAPGRPTRNCGYSEAETVMCAALGYQKGTYKLGSDLERRHAELKDHPYLRKHIGPMIDWREREQAMES